MAVQALANGFQSVKDMLFDIEGRKPENVIDNSKDNFISENQSADNDNETKLVESEPVSDESENESDSTKNDFEDTSITVVKTLKSEKHNDKHVDTVCSNNDGSNEIKVKHKSFDTDSESKADSITNESKIGYVKCESNKENDRDSIGSSKSVSYYLSEQAIDDIYKKKFLSSPNDKCSPQKE